MMIDRQRVSPNSGTFMVRLPRPDADMVVTCVAEGESYNKNNLNHVNEKSSTEALDIYSLERYGIPREVLEALVFEHGGDSSLLELQRKGIQMGLCDQKKLLITSGIISGPTGSGKTLLAELRMLVRCFDERRSVESSVEHSQRRGKTILLVPMKAIGLEKLRYFRHVYNRFGVSVRYSDGDVRTDDGDILRGKFDVAIMVNEKLKFFEQHNPEFFKNVGEVVVDELGIISDKSRGPQLEMAITGLLLSPHKPVVLALTTPLEGNECLLRLLDGFLLETENRPIDIRAGVWTGFRGEFESWSCNTLGVYLPEKMDLGYPADKDKTLKELLLRYRNGIMFAVPTKALTFDYASRLRQLIDRDAEVRKVMADQTHAGLSIEDRLKGLEATRNKETLTEFLKRGIGFHHADLTAEERREVEDAFRNREISVVFCTSTLARGINLPAETIVFLDWGDPITYAEQTRPYYGQLRDEFTNWMGRIGRFGGERSAQPVAVYLAQTAREASRIKRLILNKRAALSTHLADADTDLTGHILSAGARLSNAAFVSAKSAQQKYTAYPFNLQDIKEFFSHTPSAANEDLKCLLLNRATNCLISLANSQAGKSFVKLRELVGRLLRFSAVAEEQDVRIGRRDMPRLLYGLQSLNDLGIDRKHGGCELIRELKSALRNSLDESFQNTTLPELAVAFRDEDIHDDISWMMAVIGRVDKRHLARGLRELGELLEQDDSLDSIPRLRRIRDRLNSWIANLVEYELENTRDAAGSAWLYRVRGYRLDRQLLVRLQRMLESDEIVEALLRPAADEVKFDETVPRYLSWVEAGEKRGFELTAFGKICCSYGISITTCDELYKWIKGGAASGLRREIDVVDFFRLLLCTPDGALVSLLKTGLSPVSGILLSGEVVRGRAPLSPHDSKGNAITCQAMKDWIKGMPTIEIESKYSLRCGSLYEVSRQLSRLTRACRDIARKTLGGPGAEIQTNVNFKKADDIVRIPDDLGDLAEMLLYGLPSETVPIAHLRVEGLTRSWIVNLLRGLNELDIGEGLSVIERLQLLTEDQLKGMLPTRGLVRRLREALGEYGKAPLASKLAGDRQFILRYYLLPQVIKAQLERTKAHYAGQARNTALRVVTRDGVHTVLRRNDPDTHQPIKIHNEQELLSWVKRGAVDFYGEISEIVSDPIAEETETGQQRPPRHIIDRFFLDLDPRNGFPVDRLKVVTQRIYEFFARVPQVVETKIYWTGGKGFHVIGFFKEGTSLDVQAAKEKLTALLNSWRICNDVDIFMERDPTNLEPYLTLDLSPIMPRGIYRNELSIHAVSGGCCVEVKIDHLKDFEPDVEATPEAVARRLIAELNEEERNAYAERVSRGMETIVKEGREVAD